MSAAERIEVFVAELAQAGVRVERLAAPGFAPAQLVALETDLPMPRPYEYFSYVVYFV